MGTSQTAVRARFRSGDGPLGARARVGLCLVVAVLIAAKMPHILLAGRFWAEEGSKFFENGWKLPWRSALLAPWGGYLNITANLAGVLAWHLPPLEWAPYASSTLALLFQLCPFILVLTSGTDWLRRPLVLVAALLLLLTVPASEEVWLSSIGTQCHLTLCVGLILAFPTRAGAGVGAFRLLLLLVAALSGPASWFLTPWFALRAALERSWRRATQAAVLASGVVAQAAFFYSHEPGREYALRPLLFLDVAFAKHVLVPLLGPFKAGPFAIGILHAVQAGHVPHWPAIVVIVLLLVGGAVLVADWRREPLWLALAAATVGAISYVGALGDPAVMLDVGNGQRYAFAQQALIAMALLGCAATRHGGVRWATTALTGWLLVAGVAGFFRPVSTNFSNGPSWRAELALHRRDPSHVIAGWPPGWNVTLPPAAP